MNTEAYLKEINFCKILKTASKALKNKTVIIYGTGKLFQTICKNYDLSDLNIIGICDKKYNDEDFNKKEMGYNIVPSSKISEIKPDCILISTLKSYVLIDYLKDIIKNPSCKVLSLLDFDKKNYCKINFKKTKTTCALYCKDIYADEISSVLKYRFNNFEAKCYITNCNLKKETKIPGYNLSEIKELYENKKINSVLINLYGVSLDVYKIIRELEQIGFDKSKNIYIISYTAFASDLLYYNNKVLSKTIKLYKDFRELPMLKFLLARHCNLNCSCCSHFAPLFKQEQFLSFEKFKQDLDRMKSLFKEIRYISLLGGEPLLNKDLIKIIKYARQEFPYSQMDLISNGILLPKIDKELINTIKEARVYFLISRYPKIDKFVKEEAEKLLQQGLRVKYQEYNIESFNKRYNIKGNSNPWEMFNNCNSRICHTLVDDRFSNCYYPTTAEAANKYFNLKLPCKKSSINIYNKSINAKKILNFLSKPTLMCKYCSKAEKIKWHIEPKECKIEDFFIIE